MCCCQLFFFSNQFKHFVYAKDENLNTKENSKRKKHLCVEWEELMQLKS